jgi:hypothetical protein
VTEWTAACMDPDEWRLWIDANRRASQNRVSRPCNECPLGFAVEMRAIGRCNGEPSGAPEDEEAEDEPMDIARVSTQRVTVEVIAPCPTCLHRDVCAIKADVDGAGAAEVGLRALSPALTPRVTVDLECAFYLRDRSAGKATAEKKPKARDWTPEQRQAAAARLNAGKAKAAAEKAEREAAA